MGFMIIQIYNNIFYLHSW